LTRTQKVGAESISVGQLESKKETELCDGFLDVHKLKEEYDGRLVTLWPDGVRIADGQ
jgi:hypothetical protein